MHKRRKNKIVPIIVLKLTQSFPCRLMTQANDLSSVINSASMLVVLQAILLSLPLKRNVLVFFKRKHVVLDVSIAIVFLLA